MAEKEIKISFPEAKMEALEFFLKENNTTVPEALREQLDKICEKNVPQQVKKFVEREVPPRQEVQEESVPQRPARGGRRSGRQNADSETVPEQNNPGVQTADDAQIQETGQEQVSGMTMAM